jgi:transposase-like protein
VQREAVLVAWAITLDGRKVLLSLALGNRESHDAWRDFLRDLETPPPTGFQVWDGAGV